MGFDYEDAVYLAAQQMEDMEKRRYEAERVHVSLEEKDAGIFEVEMWRGDESIRIFFEIVVETGEIRSLLNADREEVKMPESDEKSQNFMQIVCYTPEEEFMLDNMDLVREEVYAYYEEIGKRIAGRVHYPKTAAEEELPFE